MLKTLSTVIVGLVVCMSPAAAWAVTHTFGFETTDGYGFRQTSGSEARRSTTDEPARTGTYSARLNTVDPDNPSSPQWGASAIQWNRPFGKVRDVTVSFWAYVDSSSTDNVEDLGPYAYFAVDANDNGVWDDGVDAWIIAQSGSPSNLDVWEETGLSGTSSIHVFQSGSSNYGGTLLEELYDIEYDSLAYGDMPIFSVFIGTGTWNRDDFDHVAYVDDVTITAIPEPMTMLAFGSAVAGLGGYIRRRRRA